MTNESSLNSDFATSVSSKQMVDLLPIRGEKRLIPIFPSIGEVTNLPSSNSPSLTPSKNFWYEALTYAKSTLTDYVTIRLPGRLNGRNKYSINDSNDFIYRFLINPKSISIAHQTTDTHSLTRGGWQFGVWGEDTIDLSITGVTAGQYFNPGITDRWSEYSISYRNLMELMNIFENNGYYFEGEPTIPTPYDSDYTRKRIKTHQDVELRTGNFIWKGMFTNMILDMAADNPFLIKFSLGFLAWKESYSGSSPWISPQDSNQYRGHSQEVLLSSSLKSSPTSGSINPSSSSNLTPSQILVKGLGPLRIPPITITPAPPLPTGFPPLATNWTSLLTKVP